MLLNERLYTAEEFWELCQLPENADKHWELIEGVICEMFPDSPIDGAIGNALRGALIGALISYLGAYILENGLGLIIGAETGYQVAPNTLLAPDVSFISKPRVPRPNVEQFFPFAPDLAVEVVSPSNSEPEMAEKARLYLQHGTRLVWVVYPRRKNVQVYRTGEQFNQVILTYLAETDVLSGEEVIPGFSLALAKLFAETE